MTAKEAAELLKMEATITDSKKVDEIVSMVFNGKLPPRILDNWRCFEREGSFVMEKKELV